MKETKIEYNIIYLIKFLGKENRLVVTRRRESGCGGDESITVGEDQTLE